MAELLLELLSEEIPARMQAQAADDLRRLVTEGLSAAGLGFERAQSYVTPRRMVLHVDGLPERQPDLLIERRGPRVDAPEKAITGFLRSVGRQSLDDEDICQKDTGKGTFWFFTARSPGGSTAVALVEILRNAIARMAWPKSMRWQSNRVTWVRPLHGILAALDGRDIALDVDLRSPDWQAPRSDSDSSLRASHATVGHRFLASCEIRVSSFDEYKRTLERAFVILDPAERRARILAEAEDRARAAGLGVRPDDALLDEVVGLVEWPAVLMGRIDEAFMEVPPEVLVSAMRTHQKYFALLDAEGRLAPRFLLVSNMPHDEARDRTIVAGNERVLRARLADAKFFWDQDRKVPLAERASALRDVIFHARLGTMAQKVERMRALAADLAPALINSYRIDAEKDEFVRQTDRAAQLCKADLTTGMVGEFPELQGIMGRYYARHDGEPGVVADAIAEHYAPLGPADRCPTAPVSVAVALADRIDTLVGFFGIGERPTGSKDPFALRRAALGVIRLILENKLRLALSPTFRKADSLHAEHAGDHAHRLDPQDLLGFLADRLKVALREKGVRHDLIAAVFALGEEDDLVRLLARVDALGAFLASEDGADLLTAYRRASNIVRIEEKKDSTRYSGPVQRQLLREAEEIALETALDTARAEVESAVAAEDFAAAMTALARLRPAVDAFFDRVTVNTDEPELRINRLRLLSQIRATLGGVADFSRIEG